MCYYWMAVEHGRLMIVCVWSSCCWATDRCAISSFLPNCREMGFLANIRNLPSAVNLQPTIEGLSWASGASQRKSIEISRNNLRISTIHQPRLGKATCCVVFEWITIENKSKITNRVNQQNIGKDRFATILFFLFVSSSSIDATLFFCLFQITRMTNSLRQNQNRSQTS